MSSSKFMDVVVSDLIQLYGEKQSRSSNRIDEHVSGLYESTTFFDGLEVELMRPYCEILGYQLRVKHSVTYGFDRATLTPAELEQLDLFERITCFEEYMDKSRFFIERFVETSDAVAHAFSERVSAVKASPNEASATELEELQELDLVHNLMKNFRGIFDSFFHIFVGDKFDRYIIYEKLFHSVCLSEVIPLTLQRSELADLAVLFGTLTRLTVISTDFCNTQFSSVFGCGMMLSMLLHILTARIINKDSTEGPVSSRQWTRITLLQESDRASIHLLRDTKSASYREAIAQLPRGLFDESKGHIYMSRGDTFTTLLAQFITKKFLRLYEWPERHDVKSHLMNRFVCDNISTYFMRTGRGQQHFWIKFFKQRTGTTNNAPLQFGQETPLAQVGESTFDQMPSTVDVPQNLPRIYIQLAPLHTLYTEVAQAAPKQTGRKIESMVVPHMAIGNADTRRRWESFRDFKQSYVDFYIASQGAQDTFMEMAVAFIERSGGYKALCTKHRRNFKLDEATSNLTVPACKKCSLAIASNVELSSKIIPEGTCFNFPRWAKSIHELIFPYNFLLISSECQQRNYSLSTENLDDAWVLNLQEAFVAQRFNTDKCRRTLDFLRAFELKSRMIVEEGQLKYIFASALEQLPFLRDIISVPDETDNDNVTSLELTRLIETSKGDNENDAADDGSPSKRARIGEEAMDVD